MAAFRFLLAGAILFAYMRWVKGERVVRGVWKDASIMGALLLMGGNGGVCYAQQYVPSGVTALLVGSGPFWFALLAWLWLKGPRPNAKAVAALVLGFIGLVILIGPGKIISGATGVPLIPALVVEVAALSWSVGSIYSKTVQAKASPMMMSALQMLVGGVLLLGAGYLHGEVDRFQLANFTAASMGAFFYLVIFGSLVGFSAYIYVLRHATPAVASTYAYVNPVVAVFVGWAIGGEAMTPQIIIAAAMIVGAVILLSWPGRKRAADKAASAEETQGAVVPEVEQSLP